MEDAFGGIFILSTEKCPWNIAFGFGRLGKNMKLCYAYKLNMDTDLRLVMFPILYFRTNNVLPQQIGA